MLSGWACEGTEVIIELNGEPQPAAYGTERLDTLAEEACGDTANGFGLLFRIWTGGPLQEERIRMQNEPRIPRRGLSGEPGAELVSEWHRGAVGLGV